MRRWQQEQGVQLLQGCRWRWAGQLGARRRHRLAAALQHGVLQRECICDVSHWQGVYASRMQDKEVNPHTVCDQQAVSRSFICIQGQQSHYHSAASSPALAWPSLHRCQMLWPPAQGRLCRSVAPLQRHQLAAHETGLLAHRTRQLALLPAARRSSVGSDGQQLLPRKMLRSLLPAAHCPSVEAAE